MEGLKSGYSFGPITEKDVQERLPQSFKYCTLILKKKLDVILSIHSLSNKKGHGLHLLMFSHAKTFQKIDLAILNILKDSSSENLFECLFKEKNLLISFEKISNKEKIILKVINVFHLPNEKIYALRSERDFHIDSFGKKFKVIKVAE